MTFIHKFASGGLGRAVTVDDPPPNRKTGNIIDWSEKPPKGTLAEFQQWQNQVARTLVEVWGLDFLYRVDGWEYWGHRDEPLVLIESSEYHGEDGQDEGGSADWWKEESR